MTGDALPELVARVLAVEPATGGPLGLASQLAAADGNALAVEAVSSVADAQAVLSEEHVDCVICAHDPPSVDGVEVLSDLREDHPDLPVLLATEAAGTDSAVSSTATDIVQVSDGELHPGVVTKRIRSIVSQAREWDKYEQIFDRANDGIVVHDPETGDILEANERLSSMLGYDRDEAAQLSLSAVAAGVGGCTEESLRELVRRASEEGERTTETLLRTADGGERWVEVSLEPTRVGGEDRVLAFVRDITDRKEREAEVEDRRETLRRLHEITADPDLSFEEQVERILSFGADRLGLEIGFLANVDEASGEFEVVAARGDHERIRAGAESDLAETYCRRTVDDGTESPLAVHDAPEEMAGDPAYETFGLGCYLGAEIVVDGDLYGTLCFAADDPRQTPFSDDEQTLIDLMAQWIRRGLEQRAYRRELEATRDRLERTFERIDDAVFAVDDEWRITYVNEVGAEVLRRATDADDTAELLGRDLWEEIPDAVGTAFYEQYHEAMETQESVSFEGHYEPLDVWFEVQAYPDEDGLSVYFTDITERKERERELVRLQELLEQTERIAGVGGWEIDTETMEVFWSDHLFELLGVDGDEEPPLADALDVYLPEDRAVVEEAVDAAIDSEEPFDVEARYRRTEDEIRWLRVQGVPIADGEAVTTVRGAAQDITERKDREQTLADLLDATRSFIRANDEAELVDAVVRGANTVFDYEISSVRLHDAEAGTLPPTHVSSGAERRASDLPTYDDRESLFGEVFQSGEAAVVDDLSDVTDHDYGPIDSAMVLPVGEHGVLSIGAVGSAAFDEEEVALVKLLAVAAASAFDRLEQESEMRRLARVIDHVDQKMFLLDGSGQFTYVTEPLAAYLGDDRETLTGRRLAEFVSPEDADACEDALEDAVASDGDRTRTVEVDVVGADGRRPVELELAPVEGTERGAEVAGVITDISELAATRSSLETERARFKTLFENLPDPVVEVEFVDGAPVVRYVNPAFARTFGYEQETAPGSKLNDLIVPDNEQDPAALLDGERTSVDTQRETTEGRRDFLLRGIPYSRADGTYGFAVYTDITEQKERERYLQVLNRVLRHNLRNDMNIVLALSRRLARNVEDDELAGHARTLEENAADVAALSEKAKQIERVLGRRGSETGVVDVVPHLRGAVAEQRDAHPDARLSVDVPEELWVVGDGNVQRACAELVENAVEHTDAAAPHVGIDVRDVPDQDGWVELCVRDDGPGIPDDEWHVVAGEEDISQLSHASGLGLWLARWIVESYGGELYREEDEDGTTVVLRLRRGSPGQTTRAESSTPPENA